MASERQLPSIHPPAEELAAYVRRELAGTDTARLTGHLDRCSECRRIVADLEGRSVDHDPELDAAWAALRPRVGPLIDPGAERRRPAGTTRHTGRFRGTKVRYAAAALLLLTVGASLGLYLNTESRLAGALDRIAQLELRLAETHRPHARLAEVDLFPDRALRGAEVPNLVVPAAARLVVLRLLLIEAEPGTPHRLQIVNDDGTTMARIGEVVPDALGTARVALPGDLLPAGVHHLRLTSEEDRGHEPTLEYTVQVVPEPVTP